MGTNPRQPSDGWLTERLKNPEFREAFDEAGAVESLERIFDEHQAQNRVRLITREGEPYLWRVYLGGRRTGPGRAYLHRFVAGDDPVHHNHPWDLSTSAILAGRYTEHRRTMIRPQGTRDKFSQVGPERHRSLGRGMVNTVYRDTFHWVELETPEVWTLFMPGEKVGGWGFLDGDEYVDHEEYKGRRA